MIKLFNIHVSQFLTGAKQAIINGHDLTISPAMYDLMKHATEDELQELMASIGVIDISDYEVTLLVTPKKGRPYNASLD